MCEYSARTSSGVKPRKVRALEGIAAYSLLNEIELLMVDPAVQWHNLGVMGLLAVQKEPPPRTVSYCLHLRKQFQVLHLGTPRQDMQVRLVP